MPFHICCAPRRAGYCTIFATVSELPTAFCQVCASATFTRALFLVMLPRRVFWKYINSMIARRQLVMISEPLEGPNHRPDSAARSPTGVLLTLAAAACTTHRDKRDNLTIFQQLKFNAERLRRLLNRLYDCRDEVGFIGNLNLLILSDLQSTMAFPPVTCECSESAQFYKRCESLKTMVFIRGLRSRCDHGLCRVTRRAEASAHYHERPFRVECGVVKSFCEETGSQDR